MHNPHAEPHRNRNHHSTDSLDSPLVVLEGEEDTTIRPLRPSLIPVATQAAKKYGLLPARQIPHEDK